MALWTQSWRNPAMLVLDKCKREDARVGRAPRKAGIQKVFRLNKVGIELRGDTPMLKMLIAHNLVCPNGPDLQGFSLMPIAGNP